MKLVISVFITLIILSVIAFLAFFETGDFENAQALESVNVVLTDSGFEPNKITLVKGGTITFSNTTDKPYWPASNLHPVHSIYPEFDPLRPLAPEEEWSFTFDRLGTYNFHGHLRSYFVGTIYVVEQ